MPNSVIKFNKSHNFKNFLCERFRCLQHNQILNKTVNTSKKYQKYRIAMKKHEKIS